MRGDVECSLIATSIDTSFDVFILVMSNSEFTTKPVAMNVRSEHEALPSKLRVLEYSVMLVSCDDGLDRKKQVLSCVTLCDWRSWRSMCSLDSEVFSHNMRCLKNHVA